MTVQKFHAHSTAQVVVRQRERILKIYSNIQLDSSQFDRQKSILEHCKIRVEISSYCIFFYLRASDMSTAKRASPSFRSTATVAESIFDFLIFFHKVLLYFRLYRSYGSRPPLLKVSLVIFCGNHFSTFFIKVCIEVNTTPN